MQAASKTLYECMSEVYESEWTGHDLLTVQSQNIEMLWQDFGHKMTDQVLIPLNTYQSQFPELKVFLWFLFHFCERILFLKDRPEETNNPSVETPKESQRIP